MHLRKKQTRDTQNLPGTSTVFRFPPTPNKSWNLQIHPELAKPGLPFQSMCFSFETHRGLHAASLHLRRGREALVAPRGGSARHGWQRHGDEKGCYISGPEPNPSHWRAGFLAGMGKGLLKDWSVGIYKGILSDASIKIDLCIDRWDVNDLWTEDRWVRR